MLKLRLPRFRFPALTRAEKTAGLALIAILGSGGALRAWEHSGVKLGPVRDWDSLHRLVVQARAETGDSFPCFEPLPVFAEHWPERPQDSTVGKKPDASVKKRARRVPEKTAPPSPLDINTAGTNLLQKLPGIGPSTASAIAAFRAAEGPFLTVEDLQRVKGIGPRKLALLRGLVRIGPAQL